MADPIKRALTRKRVQRGKIVSEEPNEKLVLGVKFAIGMTACLSALEVAHMAFMGTWNSEIFAAITGLSGTVMGIFVGQKS
jgi:acetylglutamate kinase